VGAEADDPSRGRNRAELRDHAGVTSQVDDDDLAAVSLLRSMRSPVNATTFIGAPSPGS